MSKRMHSSMPVETAELRTITSCRRAESRCDSSSAARASTAHHAFFTLCHLNLGFRDDLSRRVSFKCLDLRIELLFRRCILHQGKLPALLALHVQCWMNKVTLPVMTNVMAAEINGETPTTSPDASNRPVERVSSFGSVGVVSLRV